MNRFVLVLSFVFTSIINYNNIVVAQDENKFLLGKTVLLIGDSQTAGNFGRALKIQSFSRGAFRFAFEGRVGWGVIKWSNNFYSSIPVLYRRYEPDLVIIQLGGNDYQRSGRIDYETNVLQFWLEVKHYARKYNKDVKFCWIGPPRAVKPKEDIQRFRERAGNKIKKTIGERYYIKSSDITGHFGRTPDGLHFTPGGAHMWAFETMPRIEKCLENQRK